MPHARAALNEAILRAMRPQLACDPLADAAPLRNDAQVGEEQRLVLNVQATSKLRLLDQRAIARELERGS